MDYRTYNNPGGDAGYIRWAIIQPREIDWTATNAHYEEQRKRRREADENVACVVPCAMAGVGLALVAVLLAHVSLVASGVFLLAALVAFGLAGAFAEGAKYDPRKT